MLTREAGNVLDVDAMTGAAGDSPGIWHSLRWHESVGGITVGWRLGLQSVGGGVQGK
jgi:hypothetical protein